MPSFAIKAEPPSDGTVWRFAAAKTMYGGKAIAPGDIAYLFDGRAGGGAGLIGCGRVVSADPVPPVADVTRQTPRVTVAVAPDGRAPVPLGREDVIGFADWRDGRPETELNFKLYRQATNKIVGLSPATAAFLAERF